MVFFAIYGFVVLTTFISSMFILNWGDMGNKTALIMNTGRSAVLSVLWPFTVFLLIISLLSDWFAPKPPSR